MTHSGQKVRFETPHPQTWKLVGRLNIAYISTKLRNNKMFLNYELSL